MAAAQRVLYATPDADRFDVKDFLRSVCETVHQTLPASIGMKCQPTEGGLPTDMAMPLALIVNELITNAAKHGTTHSSGSVVVGLTRQESIFRLTVEDSGRGFDLATVRKTSSGLQLVLGLARRDSRKNRGLAPSLAGLSTFPVGSNIVISFERECLSTLRGRL